MRLLTVATLAIISSACQMGPLDPASLEQEVANGADFINDYGHVFLADEIGNAKVSASAENGDTLVVKLENLPLGNQVMNPSYIRKSMRSSVCEDWETRRVIEAGGKFRIELVSNTGKASQPVTIAHCS